MITAGQVTAPIAYHGEGPVWDPGTGTLYWVDMLAGDVLASTPGLGWSPDGSIAYYVDTATGRIDAFDFDGADAAFRDRRAVARIEPHPGSPDGITIDVEGGIWVALWDGGAVHRYTPDGVLDAVIRLPTPRVSACTFGGPDLGELYITTSRFELDDGGTLAGSVFRARPGITGLPAATFAGLSPAGQRSAEMPNGGWCYRRCRGRRCRA